MNSVIGYYLGAFSRTMSKVRVLDEANNSVTSAFALDLNHLRKVHAIFFSKRKVVDDFISYEELESALLNGNDYQMIVIETCDYKGNIYSILGADSEKNGVSAPIIETKNSILYFPKLRYSDFGLIRYLCEKNRINDYKLLLACRS